MSPGETPCSSPEAVILEAGMGTSFRFLSCPGTSEPVATDRTVG